MDSSKRQAALFPLVPRRAAPLSVHALANRRPPLAGLGTGHPTPPPAPHGHDHPRALAALSHAASRVVWRRAGRTAPPTRPPARAACNSRSAWQPPHRRNPRRLAAAERMTSDASHPEAAPAGRADTADGEPTSLSGSRSPQDVCFDSRGCSGLAMPLPIGHPGCCLDRRRERASLCLPPLWRAFRGPAPLGGGEVPQAATGRSPVLRACL